MNSLFLAVLPLALGAAISPTLLTLELLILAGKNRPLLRAWAFVAGAFAVLVGYTAVGLAFLGRLPDAGAGAPTVGAGIVKLVASAALAALGVHALLKKKPQGDGKPSRMQQRMATASPLVYAGLGAVGMLTNASTLVLLFPALHDITVSDAPFQDKAVVLAALLLITMSLVLLPVLAVSLLGHRANSVLAAMNRFTTTYKKQINAGIAFFFAVWLLWSGVKELLAVG